MECKPRLLLVVKQWLMTTTATATTSCSDSIVLQPVIHGINGLELTLQLLSLPSFVLCQPCTLHVSGYAFLGLIRLFSLLLFSWWQMVHQTTVMLNIHSHFQNTGDHARILQFCLSSSECIFCFQLDITYPVTQLHP